jgi:hypothetical protein
MRILVLHGNYFGDLWRKEGHEVFVCSEAPDADLSPRGYFVDVEEILDALGPERQPDAIFWGDTSSRVRVLGLERCRVPKVMWSIDTHHHADWQVPYAAVFDRVFVAQRDYADLFAEVGRHVEWLPCYAPLPAHGTPLGFASEKHHDLCFVGSLDQSRHPARVRLIRALQQKLEMIVHEGPYAETFAASRVVLNQTVKQDLNFRVFEALGCGSFLLTERSANGLLDLFSDGYHLATYESGDVASAEMVARRYLLDPDARRRIAEAGFDEVSRKHLRGHRASALLDVLSELLAAPRALPTAEGIRRLEVDLSRTYLRICDSLMRNARLLHTTGRLTVPVENMLQLFEQHLALALRHALRASALDPGDWSALEVAREVEHSTRLVGDLRRAWSSNGELSG